MNREERHKAFSEGRTGEEQAAPMSRAEKEKRRQAARRRQLRIRFLVAVLGLALMVGVIILAISLHDRLNGEPADTTETEQDEPDNSRSSRRRTRTAEETGEGTGGSVGESGTEGSTPEEPETEQETPSPVEVVTASAYEEWQSYMRQLQNRLPDWITQDFIEINKFSRPCIFLDAVNNIVIHYVGNPDTSAAANLNYFKSLGLQDPDMENPKMASSNFIVGLEGEVLQCMPIFEKAYASNNRNADTLSIEVCHPDEGGQFNEATYESLVNLCAYLCHELNLTGDDLIRHYDVTGKMCPVYYVEHPEAWEQLKEDVNEKMDELYGN